ncbi:MAG: hypothetical protein NWF00_10965 [Candidatus Bathyarchaeota archaeon]|nr:hypothetical protein [Candidatus Bathyarchaeota archaeon]
MVNLKENLTVFLARIAPFSDGITEQGGNIIITLKKEVLFDPERFVPFNSDFSTLKHELMLDNYVRLVFKTEPYKKDDIVYDFEALKGAFFQVDKVKMFVDQLRGYFRKDTSKEDVAELLKFLQTQGWTAQRLQSEIGISKITLYRYQSEKQFVFVS